VAESRVLLLVGTKGSPVEPESTNCRIVTFDNYFHRKSRGLRQVIDIKESIKS